jgi:hypothetical protein
MPGSPGPLGLEEYLLALLALEQDPGAQLDYLAGLRRPAGGGQQQRRPLREWDEAVSRAATQVAYLRAVASSHTPRR